ncbi:MAG: hypothetical protein WBF71_16335 [Microthrixaceae bacterium]
MIENNPRAEMCVWTYWVRPESEDEFKSLIEANWPTLKRLGFVNDDPHIVLRSSAEPPVYVEVFEWAPEGMGKAHEDPEVMAIWQAMSPLVEDRQDEKLIPGMTFPFFQRVTV